MQQVNSILMLIYEWWWWFLIIILFMGLLVGSTCFLSKYINLLVIHKMKMKIENNGKICQQIYPSICFYYSVWIIKITKLDGIRMAGRKMRRKRFKMFAGNGLERQNEINSNCLFRQTHSTVLRTSSLVANSRVFFVISWNGKSKVWESNGFGKMRCRKNLLPCHQNARGNTEAT